MGGKENASGSTAFHGGMLEADMAADIIRNDGVAGSSPACGTTFPISFEHLGRPYGASVLHRTFRGSRREAERDEAAENNRLPSLTAFAATLMRVGRFRSRNHPSSEY